MTCQKCKAELPENAKFCLECGSNVSGMSGESGQSGQEAQDHSLGNLRTMQGVGPAPSTDAADPAGHSMGDARTLQGTPNPAAAAARDAALSMGDAKTMASSGSTAAPGGPSRRSTPLSDRYELLDEVGRGGFARVWTARDRKLDRVVAVKRLLEGKLDGPMGRQTLERFEREATAIAQLNHRNIVMVYDHDADAEGHYIVMEHVGGGTLRDYLKSRGGRLPTAEAVELVKGIAQGLGYAHRKNLVHRDIKPANVLLQKDDDELTPKIVDFGLARLGSESELSMSGYGMGTPWYMPPEQRRNAKGVNHTADIYALGKVFYELVSGETPDNVDPEKISEPWLTPIILKCIKSNPEERYFSCEELIKALSGEVVSTAPLPAGQGGEGLCPNCGARNAEDVKYCGKCGAGMARPCPECDQENSIYRKFCAGCGTDVEGFVKYADALPVMERHRGEKRWSRVVKEYGLLPKEPRLQGAKGKEILEKVEALHVEAAGSLRQMAKLGEDVQRREHAWKTAGSSETAGVVATGQELDSLSNALEKYVAIDPHSESRTVMLTETRRLIDERDWAKASKAGEQAVSIKDYRNAVGEYSGYLKRHPEGIHLVAATERLEQAKADRIKQLHVQISEQIQACQLDEAAAGVAEGLALSAKDVGLNNLKNEIKERKKNARTLRNAAAEALKNRKFYRAMRFLREAEQLIGRQNQDNLFAKAKTGVHWSRIKWGAAALVLLIFTGFAGVKLLHNSMGRDSGESSEPAQPSALTPRPQPSQARPPTPTQTAPAAQTPQRDPTSGNVLNMQFVEVKSGSFQMGTPSGGNDAERPVRTVWITRNFWMGKYEVTQREYQQLTGNNPSHFKGDDLPVELVSWNDAVKFCEELTRRERAAGRLPQGMVYRLPTEAEWEYAARGGHRARETTYAGGNDINAVAWHSGNSQSRTQRVGTKAANELGLHDMSGNVWEWVHDWYQNSYSGLATSDPSGPRTGSYRVYRGGCWSIAASYCRVAYRFSDSPTFTYNNLGFRVVVAAPVQ